MNLEMSLAAVSMKTTLKYRRGWNKHSPAVTALQEMMPTGNGKKGYRLYIDIGQRAKTHYSVPASVRAAVTRAGFVITDYLAKKCVKAADKEQKNVFNIGKVIAKDQHAKAAFDNDPQLQNSKAAHPQVVISCHPYDIIGMSTGRDWDKQSCMRLDDGISNVGNVHANMKYVKHDVAEGTLVAYAIQSDDNNIQKPLCRMLIKPFRNAKGDVLYRREGRVYGNPVPGFIATINKFLRKFNEKAPDGRYEMSQKLYDDLNRGHTIEHTKEDRVLVTDVIDDPSDAVPFVQDRINEYKENATLGKITGILQVVTDADLEDTQRDEIAAMLKDIPDVKTELLNQIVGEHKLDPRVVDIMERIDAQGGTIFKDLAALVEHKDIPAAFPNILLKRFAVTNGTYMDELLKRITAGIEDDEGESIHAHTINDILKGNLPVPKTEVLDKYPKFRDELFTLASAARFMHLFDDNRMQKNTYGVMAAVPDAEKVYGRDITQLIYKIRNQALYMSWMLDNETRLEADDVYLFLPSDMTEYFKNRRAFRAMNRSKDPYIEMFMGEIKTDIFEKAIRQINAAEQYRDVLPSVVEYIDAENTYIQNAFLENDQMERLAKISVPLSMKMNSNNRFFGTNSGDLMDRLLPIFAAYEGPKLIPANDDMKQLLQVLDSAGRLMDKNPRLASKFDIEPISMVALAEAYPAWGKTFGCKLTEAFSYIKLNGMGVDLSNNQELMMHDAPDSFAHVGKKDLARNWRLFTKWIKEINNLHTFVKAIVYFDDACELVEPENEEDYVSRKMILSDIDPNDSPDAYIAAQDEFQMEIELINEKTVGTNSVMLNINQTLVDLLEENNTDFLETFPKFRDQEGLEALSSARDRVVRSLDFRTIDHQSYKEEAGFD